MEIATQTDYCDATNEIPMNPSYFPWINQILPVYDNGELKVILVMCPFNSDDFSTQTEQSERFTNYINDELSSMLQPYD